MELIKGGKGILVGFEDFNLDDYPDLKVIGCNATSTEHLPWEEINKRGIKVFSLKGETEFLETISSTAEHTIGLIIALARNYKTALNAPYGDRDAYIGHKLRDKTLGIWGAGRIGIQVCRITKAMGMRVFFFNDTDQELNKRYLQDCDVVSLHIPLANNEGFFTKEMLQKMKPTACLINTSRGKIIEQGALIWALENKIISGAAIDFIDDEELLNYSKTHANLILTPHLGGNSHEDRRATEHFIRSKIKNFLNSNHA